MSTPTRLLAACVCIVVLAAGVTLLVDLDPSIDSQLRRALADAGVTRLDPGPAPDSALVELGRALFFDREMSGRRDIACATCHLPSQATVDGLSLSLGTGASGLGPERQVDAAVKSILPRNAIDLFNRGSPEWRTFFWDGRVRAQLPADGQGRPVVETPAGFPGMIPPGADNLLAVASMFPVGPSIEMKGEDRHIPGEENEFAAVEARDMHGVWDGLMQRFLKLPGYVDLFARAYPDVPKEQLTFQHVGNALAALQIDAFTLLESPFDRYLAGDDSALSEQEKRGGILFYGKAKCAACHGGNLFTDHDFHNIGAPQIGPGMGFKGIEDLGRAGESNDAEDRFKFRTPPLRNVTETGPWFHNGVMLTLREAVEYHLDPETAFERIDLSKLPREIQQVSSFDLQNLNVMHSLDHRVATPLELSETEVDELMAFLKALTDPAVKDMGGAVPDSVPSGLRFDKLD